MSEERREYFRIDDEVCSGLSVDKPGARPSACGKKSSRAWLTGLQRLPVSPATSRQMTHVMHKVQNQSPELARCLQAIDQKLNMIAQLFVSEGNHSS